jgi:pSer/pThr/pTyr-binding forkhead associated (FHA) protein
MSADPSRLHQSTPAELKAKLEAERAGEPFLLLRDGVGAQRIVALPAERAALSIGRDDDADVRLEWDPRVSRLHATLERAGGAWTIGDEGLSRNGTFVNHERLTGRRRLSAGDVVRTGDTELVFHESSSRDTGETELAGEAVVDAELSKLQRRVLAELCRPLHDKGAYASPATNQEIADAVFLSTVAVKTHLRTLFAKFGLAELPQNRKRAALAEAALRSGALSERDFTQS